MKKNLSINRIVIISVFSYILFGWEHRLITKSDNDKESDEHYQNVNKQKIDSLLHEICVESPLEFIDLYKSYVDSIANDHNENSILVDLLKTKKFKVIDWGRGNWTRGPRIVSFKISRGQCECNIDKLYFSTQQKNIYRVTERIRCKSQKS